MKNESLTVTIEHILTQAKKLGATAAEASVLEDQGFNVIVRQHEVETVEYQTDRDLNLTVYFGQKKGSASTTDMREESLMAAVKAACDIAKMTSEDTFSGLADAELMPKKLLNLDLHHPWKITPVDAIDLALACEKEAFGLDKKIINSDGVTVSTFDTCYVYGNSHGFMGEGHGTTHEMSACLIAEQNGQMERDYSYTVSRYPEKLMSTDALAKEAAMRTIARLGARQIPTMKVPVIFNPEMARGLIRHLLSAISGGALYRKTSFLVDTLGKPVLSDALTLHESPHLLGGLASSNFDSDGVATYEKAIVKSGVLESYLLSAYSARRLDMKPTGNASGITNLLVQAETSNPAELLKKMGKGILVTEVMGQGVNIVTGDYSRGIAGFWVENGEIQYPISEVTIAGNLCDMLKNIVAVGDDTDMRGNVQVGSLLLEEMMVAGS